MPPEVFIPLAEQQGGLVLQLSSCAFEKARRPATRWQAGSGAIRATAVSVNLTARRLRYPLRHAVLPQKVTALLSRGRLSLGEERPTTAVER